jgi:mitogen-activated protein kinase 15
MEENKNDKNIEQVDFHIAKRFNINKILGKGAYGVVFKATDKKTNEIIALKKLYDAFRNETDSQRTFREVMILQELNGHENIIRLLNVIKAQNNMDLYLVFEYMEADLYNVIKANILQEIHKKFVIYQVLKALKFIHSADIIHRDLKPSNIFINSDCTIKLGDFGLARTLVSSKKGFEPMVTDYVATRWYRAPEMLLGSPFYTKSVDMWSVGCILLECIIKKPMFPGKSTKNQIILVLEFTGLPSKEEYNKIRYKYDFQVDYETISSTKISRKSLKTVLSTHNITCSSECVDFISKLLVFDPEKRLTVEEALKHPFLNVFHKEEEEYICNRIISLSLDDNYRYTVDNYRNKLYEEVLKRKIEIRNKLLQTKDK